MLNDEIRNPARPVVRPVCGIPSILHRCGIFYINGFETTIQVDDDSDSKGNFRGGHHYDEHGEKDAFQLVRIQIFVERYEIDIDTVQDEFQRHQHGNEITA
jgi:hypothetical protein